MDAKRRLFVGDLHGCLDELDGLLAKFAFRPGLDSLYSVGDVVGKGPRVPDTLRRLRALGAGVVLGNHDAFLVDAVHAPEAQRTRTQREYIDQLGTEAEDFAAYIGTWPLYIELADIILVHAGLEPGKKDPAAMRRRILLKIRTWDGMGENLDRPGDPPWFECVETDKTVIFGHWAQRGLIDLPRFKGLDTGCVYGGKLTGWCPEEDRFHQVEAKRAYSTFLKPD